MLFPTVEYTLFFLIVLTAAWSLYRWVTIHKAFLLLASYVFYGIHMSLEGAELFSPPLMSWLDATTSANTTQPSTAASHPAPPTLSAVGAPKRN